MTSTTWLRLLDVLRTGYGVAKPNFKELLKAEAAVVEELVAANEMQEHKRGGAQEATKQRDAKLDELDQWLATYKVVTEVALSDTPQMLEQLGWVVPS